MGDQQDRRVDAAAQLLDQVEDLGFDRGVEAGGRLVEDEQVRVGRQRHGDDNALLLPAGELERVAAHGRVGVGQGHLAQTFARVYESVLLGHALVVAIDLGDLVADAHGRAQGRGGVLIDHGHGLAAPLEQRLVGERADVAPLDQHLAGVDRTVGGQVAQGGHGQGGLAAARFADQTVGLAGLDAQGDALEHRQVAAAAVEGDLEVADVERGRRGPSRRRAWSLTAVPRRSLREDRAQAVGDKVHADHERRQGEGREQHDPRRGLQVRPSRSR